ncbi:MAG: hypothetical protein ACE5OW_07905, partial [Candidatus Bathyarchaeia archaeon]
MKDRNQIGLCHRKLSSVVTPALDRRKRINARHRYEKLEDFGREYGMAEKEKWPESLLEELRFEEGKVLVRDERFFLGHKYMLEFMHSTFE